MKLEDALTLIRDIPDFPSHGINFYDITPLLAHPEGLSCLVEAFQSFPHDSDLIAGIEARGFILAAAYSQATGLGFIPIRKAGKLPHNTYSQNYNLEYGNDALEIHSDAILPNARVLVMDDVLATGGTIEAAIELVHRCGGVVDLVIVLLELSYLGGRKHLESLFPKITIRALKVI